MKQNEYTDKEMQDKLVELLSEDGFDDDKLNKELLSLEKKYSSRIYTNLLYLLSHIEFSPNKAKTNWSNILNHREKLIETLNRPVDFRVALLDYFLEQNKKIQNPKIIEIQIFRKTQESIFVDELTGLYNYRYFQKELVQEVKRSKRYDLPLTLILFDIDDFKHYNDKNGHMAGNDVLKKLSKIIKDGSREIDIVARYGGEEFVLILPQTNKQGGIIVADRILQKIRNTRFRFGSKQPLGKITVSGGLATFPQDAIDPDNLFKNADKAMYQAKAYGKNHIKYYQPENRAFTRIDSAFIGNFWLLSEKPYQMETKNISRNGVLFSSNKYLPISSIIEIQLNLPTGKRAIAAKAKVIRVEEIANFDKYKYEIGVQITQMKREDRKIFDAYLETLSPTDITS